MRRMFHTIVSCAVTAALMASALTTFGNTAFTTTAEAATAPANATATAPSRVSVHDPSIAVSKEGVYYVFGSHLEAAKSTDMVNWELFTNGYTTPNNKLLGNLDENLKVPFAWAGSHDRDATTYSVWAPDVYKAGSTTQTFTKNITVKKAYFKFKKSKPKMTVGKSATFKLKGYGVKASSAVWKSSKKKVLTVGKKNGKVKALKAGTATITASYKKIKLTKKVTVKKK